MKRIIAPLGFDGQRRLFGDGRVAGFFCVALLLLTICFMVQEALYGDMISWGPGGLVVSIVFFWTIAVQAFLDFAVGRLAPYLVGAARIVAFIISCAIIAFWIVGYAVTGQLVAFLAIILLSSLALTIALLVRWWLFDKRSEN